MKNIINTLNRSFIKILPPKRVLWIIFVGLILRLTVFMILQPWTEKGQNKILKDDAYGYHKLAVELKNEGTFGQYDPQLSALRTPGYPCFIVLFYKIFGEKPWIILLVQIVLDCILIAVIYSLAKKIFEPKTAFIAALCYSLEPLTIQYVNILLSDMLFLFFLVISWLFLWNFIKENKNKWLLLNISLLAAAVYIRPIALYLFFAELIFIVSYLAIIKRHFFKIIMVSTILYFFLISPWIIRNRVVHKHWFFSTSADYNSLILYAADVEADARGIPSTQINKEYQNYFAEKYPHITNENIYDLHRLYKEKALGILKKYPKAFIYSYVTGLVDMFFSSNRQKFELLIDQQNKISYDAIEMLRKKGLIALKKIYNDYPSATLIYISGMLCWYFLCYFFAGVGIFQIFRKKDWLKLSFILLPVLYFALLTGQAGLARFKLPIIPFYLLLTAYGIKYAIDNKIPLLLNQIKKLYKNIL